MEVSPRLSELMQDSRVRYQPKAADASPDRVRDLAGLIVLTGPVPSHKFLEGHTGEKASHERAGD